MSHPGSNFFAEAGNDQRVTRPVEQPPSSGWNLCARAGKDESGDGSYLMNARESPAPWINAADMELAEVLDAYLTDLLAGKPVDPQRLVDEHPTIATRLRVCLAGLSLVEQERRQRLPPSVRFGLQSSGRPDPSVTSSQASSPSPTGEPP